MDEMDQISKDSKEIVITDKQIEEVHPTLDSHITPKKPLWEQDVDEEVGADEPVEREQNVNIEDEEVERQKSGI